MIVPQANAAASYVVMNMVMTGHPFDFSWMGRIDFGGAAFGLTLVIIALVVLAALSPKSKK